MRTTRQEDMQLADRLWADYARRRDPRTRAALIEQFRRLAFSIANRFARRGVESEDLVQVAMVGLVKAVDRFDPSTPYRFSTFAIPTIVGEIKRYFRDHSWSFRVPRSLQERVRQVENASWEQTKHLGRPPTIEELAAQLGLSEEQVLEAVSLAEHSQPLSLDGELEATHGEGPILLEDCLGSEDSDLQNAEHRVSVDQALRHLSEPLRRVIELRYFRELSQRETARRLGVSQMQVSRLEKQALGELRGQFAVH